MDQIRNDFNEIQEQVKRLVGEEPMDRRPGETRAQRRERERRELKARKREKART